MFQESELKLAISQPSMEALLSSSRIKRVAKGKVKRKALVSTYFDTRQHTLRKSGVALRIRYDGRGYEQTIKIPSDGPAGMQNFSEFNVDVPDMAPDLSLYQDDALTGALERWRYRGANLRPVFATRIERDAYVLKLGKTKIEMALDRGEIISCIGSMPNSESVCEVELEMIAGNPVDLFDFAQSLLEKYDVWPLHLTKAERGYSLIRGDLRPRATKAKKVSVAANSTIFNALHGVLSAALEHLFVNHAPTLAGQPEGVHQTRVALRRIRAALRAFKGVLPWDERMAFNGELRRTLQQLGAARDWHVFLPETWPLLSKAALDDVNVKPLQRIARNQRLSSTREAIAVLTSRRYMRMLVQFERWLASMEETGELAAPIRPYAERVLKKTLNELVDTDKSLKRMWGDELHDLRKRGKKTRYAFEFFNDLISPDGHKLIKTMSSIQDALGEANDALMARQLLTLLKPGATEGAVVHFVDHWASEQIESRLNKAGPHWARVRKTARDVSYLAAERPDAI